MSYTPLSAHSISLSSADADLWMRTDPDIITRLERIEQLLLQFQSHTGPFDADHMHVLSIDGDITTYCPCERDRQSLQAAIEGLTL